MPEQSHDLETATAVAKKVLPEMARWKVPLIPENYHVWFEYTVGSNERLRSDMETVMSSGGAFVAEINEDLYHKHIGAGKSERLMRQVQKETQKVLKNILEDILVANRHTSDYSQNLRHCAQKLNEAKELCDIQDIIKNVLTETSRMAESANSLKERLEKASTDADLLRQRLQETEREARIDALTGLHNRKAFGDKIHALLEEYRDSGALFSVVMLDIDHFKSFNDKFGHKIGDDALEIVGSILKETIKGKDFPARYGGEEFVVLLPDTVLSGGRAVAEQIRQRISENNLKLVKTGKRLGKMTVSLGVSEINDRDTADTVMERADKALYLAKGTGRNNVKTERDLNP